jgi:hypothetical protein
MASTAEVRDTLEQSAAAAKEEIIMAIELARGN